MRSYDHRKIEAKWQEKWEKEKLYEVKDEVAGRKNRYVLVEYPYPSGNLHIGHWYAFSVPDIYARAKRMQGENVLFPMGFDSFGLPAENAAIKNKVDPREWTEENIKTMTKQLKSMGNSFDWSRRLAASDPDYYKWTQWLFLKFLDAGLAYRGKAAVNWDPVDQTVLANEQVLPDGTGERSGAKVERRYLEQWFIRITDYADRLVDDLEVLEWPEQIKESQRNWIGRKSGAEIDFKVTGTSEKIKVFTTRPDTLFGATYMVLAPEHELAEKLKNSISNWSKVTKYIKEAELKSDIDRTALDKEKTGVLLEGVSAINPANESEIPVYIADYVLAHYGTGAIMAVPAHDERDHEFAVKFGIEEVEVVEGGNIPYTGEGILKNSGEFNGMDNEDAKIKITERVGGALTNNYKLRDWLVSRQRYWGAPIPVVYDPNGNPHPIPEEHLPWLLPQDISFDVKGKSPLSTSKEFVERTESIFGQGWTPEMDTFDTFVDSSWYFLRYLDPKNESDFSDIKKQKKWMPVDMYSGGAEHTTMHVLYSRFFYKALFDLKLVTDKEPYKVRMNRGIILGTDGAKMSKSKGNVIDPDDQVKNVGADCVKMYLAFVGPYGEVGTYPWDMGGIAGIRRFLERVWGVSEKVEGTETSENVRRELNKTIKKVEEDIDEFKFNTAISQMMILVNKIEKEGPISKGDFMKFLRVLAPFAPHLTEEIWEGIGNKKSLHLDDWPIYEEKYLQSEEVKIAVQVNGKVRATISIPTDSSEEETIKVAKKDNVVSKWLGDSKVKKQIYVKNRLINFVT
ncbi:MAG: leucine--tRNA ligase [Candidatus Pacebacteria bacterium]|jgi:leucyl-tRNA synthetase|nr:leucine--tRNA ligase [bacterium]MDP6527786.1 leucine--tRNA ligase [Candidatus Paceibacterota bacterium]MDP6659623.1 leucine--tRNA ligase [Candidatus Paceibacterota bacterium]|tara:strand:- start:49865 stop:52246 length:2382 start_codon:yes stop_codon:yes gene_type:complete